MFILNLFKLAFNATKKNFVVLIGVFLSIFLVSFIFEFIVLAAAGLPLIAFVLKIVSMLIQLYIGVGLVKLGLSIVDGKEPEFVDIKPSWIEIVRYFMANLLVGILVMLIFFITFGVLGGLEVIRPGLMGIYKDLIMNSETFALLYSRSEILYALTALLLLAIPAMLIYFRLQFANYIVVDKESNPANSILESFNITKGYLLYILLTFLLIFVLNIIGMLLVFVGLLFTIPMSFMVLIFLYRSLIENYEAKEREELNI